MAACWGMFGLVPLRPQARPPSPAASKEGADRGAGRGGLEPARFKNRWRWPRRRRGWPAPTKTAKQHWVNSRPQALDRPQFLIKVVVSPGTREKHPMRTTKFGPLELEFLLPYTDHGLEAGRGRRR